MFKEKRRIAWCEKPSHFVSEALWVGPEFHPWFCHWLPQGRFFSWYYSPVSSINTWVLIVSSGTGEHFVLGTIYNDGDDRCHLPNRKSAPMYRIYLTRSTRTLRCGELSPPPLKTIRKGIPAVQLRVQASLSSHRWTPWCLPAQGPTWDRWDSSHHVTRSHVLAYFHQSTCPAF